MDYAPGWHLLIDMEGAAHLTDAPALEAAMRAAAGAAGATVLSAHLHGFKGGGVTGVLLLAESHISIHTWPERGYAALDVFMCGKADVDAAARVLVERLAPIATRITRHQRNQASQPAL